jgi:hypothetical protein
LRRGLVGLAVGEEKQEPEGRKEEQKRKRKGKGLEGDATQNERQAGRA